MYVKLRIAAIAVLALALPATAQLSSLAAGKAMDLLAEGFVFNIIDWDGGELPKRYERSDQQPLSLADVRKLSANKFSTFGIIKMLEERRCACDASADALVGLKKDGISEQVIQAVSLHALPPNRSFGLTISLDFEGLGGASTVSTQARKGYLYLIVPDDDKERVFIGNLQAILARRWQRDELIDNTDLQTGEKTEAPRTRRQRDELIDNTDLLLPKKVRRVTFASEVPLKTYGLKKALVFTSTKPDIYTSADIPEADRDGVQEFEFEYPTASVESQCSLQVLYRQDAMLANRWHLERTHFQCEWD